jgi:acyl-[acyl-carrier-protein]-phospholipid O-acyltransferase/long-chain-fatty-acid--[acyl-carrier-protein] ligase
VYQPGSRRGSVGQPLPGVAVRTVDPETGAPRAVGEPGMLLVRAASVFGGYLGRPDLTAEVLHDGWYTTGDIAVVDADGFVRITDRLARFSKIGGEMVPHGRVEEALHAAAGIDTPAFLVTSLTDAKKGEKLAVLHTLEADRIGAILEGASAAGLPNLFLPRAENFVRVESLPLLGTGKLDLRTAREIAQTALDPDAPSETSE